MTVTGAPDTLPPTLRRLSRGGGPFRARLVCFPYAGAGAYAYRRWASMLPPDLDVYAAQLPGREDRAGEDPLDDVEAAVDLLATELGPFLQKRYAIFGHSLGAVVGAEVARRLPRSPDHLLVSGCRALPVVHVGRQPLSQLPDDSLLAHIRELGGTPEEILLDPAARRFVLRLVRADYALFDGYMYAAGRQLSCPVTVLAGADDPTTERTELAAWSALTTGPTEIHVLPGGHFFVHSAEEQVVELIATTLADVGADAGADAVSS